MKPEDIIVQIPYDLYDTYAELDNLTPISYAAKYGLIDFIEKSILNLSSDEKETLLAFANPVGLTALHFACRYGQIQAAQTLIKNGAPLLKASSLQLLPIQMIFSDKNDLETCNELFSLFIYDSEMMSQKTLMNETLAHLAASKGATDILKKIKSVKPELLNAKDNYSMIPLLRAVIGNQKDTVEYLLENSNDIHQKNSKGQNALHLAVISSPVEIINALLPYYDSNILDNENNSALDLARKFKHKEKEDAIIFGSVAKNYLST